MSVVFPVLQTRKYNSQYNAKQRCVHNDLGNRYVKFLKFDRLYAATGRLVREFSLKSKMGQTHIRSRTPRAIRGVTVAVKIAHVTCYF